MIRPLSYILLLLCLEGIAQDTLRQEKKPDYRRKEEIIYYGKRYRIHNNYVTLGAGFLNSSIRSQSQKCGGADFVFHIREQHFQTGLIMSGEELLSNNNLQVHIGYGYRHETNTLNLAVFGGPTWFTGVTAYTDPVSGITRPDFYNGYGAYVSLQGISKFYYDFGLGLELFGDISYRQTTFGFKIIAFFSGAYRGPKKNYNVNVRSENP
jgi:hypothetical protein